MSWTMTKEVRAARLAGKLDELTEREFSVLMYMAETCRGESREASIGMSELEKLTGRNRSTVFRAVKGLLAKLCVIRTEYGSPGQASKYEILPPESRSTGATWTRGTNATCDEPQHVANEPEHVANETDHVAPVQRTRCSPATYPDTDLTIPTDNPAAARASAYASRARTQAHQLVNVWIPGKLRTGGGRKQLLIDAVMAGVRGLGEDGTAQVVADWLESPQNYSAHALASRIDKALSEAGR